MTEVAGETRPFRVHARHVDGHQARIIEEASFEAAAVAYVEDFHPPVDADNEVSVIVRDLDDGREHCFRIDLDSGDAAPCG
ncbi:DUF5961 family protein [Phenylobacterium sp.]|uniref:DUF5961 family protein n=1 Tax=Phenylobacterium sp. TaxID=1871053 RepID=UPI00273042C5|nr:DUF5961 family protein [Phenylobacterium sp.]MDP1601100.1 DUF5961 family protein [Phenylobacterium sp.]MDP3593839.1 DUF5961 family protein [Phenylobacterium sp.]